MDLFEIDFDERLYERSTYNSGNTFSDDDFADMTAEADIVISNEKEDTKRRAEACLKKFRLLETRRKLAPKLLEKALDLCPDMPQALMYMGRFFLHTGNREKALEYFNKAVAADPAYPYALLERAALEKDPEVKIRLYSKFIELKPDSKTGYEKRCRLYEEKSKNNASMPDTLQIIQQAINDYSELIRLDSSNREYYRSRAELRLRYSMIYYSIYGGTNLSTEINNDALKDIERLMLLCPADNVCNCIATVHNLLQQWSNGTATKYITQIAVDLPSDSAAYLIAQILFAEQYKDRDEEKAVEIYSKTIDLLKNGDALWFFCFCNRAKIYYYSNEFEKALADYAVILEYGSLFPQERRQCTECHPYFVRTNRAKIFKKMNDLTGAINEFTLLLEECNNTDEDYIVSAAYTYRAGLFADNGEFDKALSDYSAVIDMGGPGSRKYAYAARIEIYRTRGEMDKAFANYIKMSELKNNDSLIPCAYFDESITRDLEKYIEDEEL